MEDDFTGVDGETARLIGLMRDRATQASSTYVIFDDFPRIPISNIWADTRQAASRRQRSMLFRPATKVDRALHPHGHRPRRPRARSDLRLRHHRLCRRAMGPALDHHRHHPRRAGARPHAADGRALSLLSARRQPRRAAPRKHEVTGSAAADTPTHDDIRQGFVYERVPHITLKSIANNAEIDVIWEKWQAMLEPLRAATQRRARQDLGRMADPARAPTPAGPPPPTSTHAEWWEARIARQKEIDASIAAHGRRRIPLRQALRRQVPRPRRRPVHGREPVAAPRACPPTRTS